MAFSQPKTARNSLKHHDEADRCYPHFKDGKILINATSFTPRTQLVCGMHEIWIWGLLTSNSLLGYITSGNQSAQNYYQVALLWWLFFPLCCAHRGDC